MALINYTQCLIKPRMYFSSILLLVGSLVEEENRERSLIEGKNR